MGGTKKENHRLCAGEHVKERDRSRYQQHSPEILPVLGGLKIYQNPRLLGLVPCTGHERM